MKKNSIVLIVALVVLIAAYFVISASLKDNEENLVNENENLNEESGLVEDDLDEEEFKDETVFCTMDAMECPDGSYVGRVAPDCEFAACSEAESIVVEKEIAVPELIDEPISTEEEPETVELIVQ